MSTVSTDQNSAVKWGASGTVILFVVAIVIGIVGGAAYLHISAFVSSLGWPQNSIEDGSTIAVGGVTLFELTWETSILTPFVQSIVGTFVPPIVGLHTGVLVALAAFIGCSVGSRKGRGTRRIGVFIASVFILVSGAVLSAFTGSLLALLYVVLFGAVGAALVFGLETLVVHARRRRSPRIY